MEFMGGGDLATIIAILKQDGHYLQEDHIAFITGEVSILLFLTSRH